MSPKDPFEIPEVTAHVASFLSDKDLAHCIRVSKTWRDMFLSHRWRVVEKSYKCSYDPSFQFGPSQEDLHKHRHLVRDLSIRGRFSEDEMCTYPTLLNLRINFYRKDVSYRDDRGAIHWDLTEKSPLLDQFSLIYVYLEPPSYHRLSEHPHLRSLRLEEAIIKDVVVSGFWEACKNLKSLSMERVRFEGGFVPVPTDTMFTRLHTLSMKDIGGLHHSRQLAVVFHCPKLKSFEWRTYPINVRILLNHPVQKDRWQLDNLSIPVEPLDAEWASVLERLGNGLGNFTCLELNGSAFGSKALKALDSHFNSLVDLRFYHSTSSVVRDVLCSCPMLEILHASDVFAKDIVEGGPWVCQQLRELRICFRVRESEQDLRPLVFERLSTLVRLLTLDMGSPEDECNDNVLEFRLSCGLGQLTSLKELRAVGFHFESSTEEQQRLGVEEIEWMIDNWKKLKGIYGHLNRDSAVEAQLKCLVENRGILYGKAMMLDTRLNLD